MWLFPATLWQEFVEIDILGYPIKTTRRDKALLVISCCFVTLVKIVPPPFTSVKTVTRSFVANWMLAYGSTKSEQSNKGNHFTENFLHHMCCIIGVLNLFSTTYHPQTNCQIERLSRKILDVSNTTDRATPKNGVCCDIFSYLGTTHRSNESLNADSSNLFSPSLHHIGC